MVSEPVPSAIDGVRIYGIEEQLHTTRGPLYMRKRVGCHKHAGAAGTGI